MLEREAITGLIAANRFALNLTASAPHEIVKDSGASSVILGDDDGKSASIPPRLKLMSKPSTKAE